MEQNTKKDGSTKEGLKMYQYICFILVLLSAVVSTVDWLILLFSREYIALGVSFAYSILITIYLFVGAACLHVKEKKLKGTIVALVFGGLLGFKVWEYAMLSSVLSSFTIYLVLSIAAMTLAILGGILQIIEKKMAAEPLEWGKLTRKDITFLILLGSFSVMLIVIFAENPPLLAFFGSMGSYELAVGVAMALASFTFMARNAPSVYPAGYQAGTIAAPGSFENITVHNTTDHECLGTIITVVVVVIVGVLAAIGGLSALAASHSSSIPGFEPVIFLTIVVILGAFTLAGYRNRLKR